MLKRSILKGSGLITVIMLTVGSMFGCSQDSNSGETADKADAVELTVSAAASLTEAMGEIEGMYEEETGNELNVNLGSSGALQKQIEEGAPTDVFISASNSKMEALKEGGFLKDDSIVELLGNRLVLIVSHEYADKIASVDDLATTDGQIAIGEVETVPVGQYSKESLKSLNMWSSIQDKIVFAKDVKAVLSYVETGNTAAGMVYKSDAVGMKSGSVAQEIDPSTHKPIVYPAAIVKDSENEEAAAEFLEFLENDESKAVFEKYGFEVK